MQGDFIDQYDWGDWLEQFLPNITGISPGFDPTADGFFGQSFLQLLDVLKVYLQDQDTDDINRIFRAKEFTTLFSVLQDYDKGRATLEDVKAVDVGLLSDIDEFNEWYNTLGDDVGSDDGGDPGFTGNGYVLTAEEVKTTVDKIGQDVYDQATGALNNIVDETKAIVNDPLGAIQDIASNILTASTGVSASAQCDKLTRGGPEWVKNCVKFGGILSIPGLEIPAAILGGVFSGVTIQDMEDVLVEAGKKLEDIKNGVPTCGENNDEACTPENILGDIGDWVVGKVTDVFADVKDGVGSITVEGVLKKIGEFLPPAVAAVVYGEFKDQINTAIGVPVFLTTAEECASKNTIEDPDNPGSCLPISVVEEEGTFDCASINQKGGIVNSAEDCGGCLDNYQASANGCVATPVTCNDNEEYNEATNKCEPVVSFTEGAPCNTSEGSGKYNAEGECVVDDVTVDDTVDGADPCTTEPDAGSFDYFNCIQEGWGYCSENTEKQGQWVLDPANNCGETTTVTTGVDVEPEECPAGQTRNAEGQCEDNPIVINDGGDNNTVEPPPPPPGSPCAQQNRVENEDGSCGECLPGYMIDPKGFDQCVTTGIPVTGGPEPEPEPEAPSGGGGGGGSGGMFEPASLELSYNRTPELVVSNKPFVDYSAQLDAQVARLLTNRKDIV
jgi:hypothetical protein